MTENVLVKIDARALCASSVRVVFRRKISRLIMFLMRNYCALVHQTRRRNCLANEKWKRMVAFIRSDKRRRSKRFRVVELKCHGNPLRFSICIHARKKLEHRCTRRSSRAHIYDYISRILIRLEARLVSRTLVFCRQSKTAKCKMETRARFRSVSLRAFNWFSAHYSQLKLTLRGNLPSLFCRLLSITFALRSLFPPRIAFFTSPFHRNVEPEPFCKADICRLRGRRQRT